MFFDYTEKGIFFDNIEQRIFFYSQLSEVLATVLISLFND